MRKTPERQKRSLRAFTLVEMLVACVLIGLIGAGIAQLIIALGMTYIKVSNKVDNLNAARQVIERIGRTVREARNIGDIYGDPSVDSSNNFPCLENPLYAQSYKTPPGGWPWGYSNGSPASLAGDTLIVQVPVFDPNGFPTSIQAGTGSPAATETLDNVDTYIFHAIADPNNPGSYELQLSAFPGLNSSEELPANPPQTILKNIVGPLDSSGNLSLFQYIAKDGSLQTPDGLTNANLTGILVTFEVLTTTSGNKPATIGIKSEVYMRNNTLMTISQPS